ncbi:hypothetical protein SAMN05216357_112130 [Porphyromonadaceae bacterium KH3CP3RA]|nr:hypothetical protein SAMN05216357_112130 [Porphyromonadaceae bacterium KH3CP3RA]
MAEEPVEIDINLRQNVDTEANKAADAIARLAAESSRAQEDASRMINVQRDVVSRLKSEIESLQKAFSNISIDTNDEKAVKWRQETYQQIRALNIELADQEGILAKLEARNNALATSKGKLLSDIEAVATGMNNLTAMGRGESEQYKELEAQLATMADAYMGMKDEQDKIIAARVDLESFSASLDGVTNSIQSGVEQFGNASEKTAELTESLEAVGRAQAVVDAGQKSVNDTVAETAEKNRKATEETQKWSVMNQFLAKTFNISNAAAQRLIATMSLGLGIAIGAVTKLIQKQIEKWREAKREQEEFDKSVASNAASQIANYEKLRASYNKLGDDLKAKEKFILDNQSAFRQLGVSINDVNAADNLFISQTDAFRSAIEERARAAAAMEMAADKYRAAWQKQLDADEREKNPTAWDKRSPLRGWYLRDGETISLNVNAANAADKLRQQAAKEEKAAQDYVSRYVASESKAAEDMKNANIDATNKLTEGTKAWWEWQKKNAQTRLDTLKDTEQNSEEWNRLADEIRSADKVIKSFDITGSDKRDAGAEKKAEIERKKVSAAAERLKKWGVDIQNDIDAAVVAAMEEGREKKLEELKADYDKRIALIEQRRHEIELLEKETGVDGSAQKGLLDTLADNEKKKYEAQVKVVTTASRKVLSEVWNEINSRFRTENENRLAEIDLFYAEQTKKAKENGATQEQLDNISLSHKRDIELEKHQIALETLDFEAQIELRRAEIADERVHLQTDREEKILKIQLDAAKKRLAKLQEIEATGGDAAKDIELVQTEIENLSASIRRIPVNRIKEIGSHLKSWLNSLSGIGGDLGDSFAALADNVDGITAAFDKDTTTYDHAGNAISGLVKLYQMAAAQLEENRRKQEEWNAAIEEASHKARMMRIEELEYQKSNVFGVENPYASAIAGANQYRQAMTELNDSLNKLAGGQIQTGTKKVVSGKNVATGVGAGAAVGGAIGSVVPVIGTALGAVIGGVLGGIFGATRKKVVPVFESLAKEFGSILKEGTETFELNPKILENYSKLDDATKKLVDNWEQIREKALEAQEQMRQTFADLAGDIGNSLSSALVNSFRNNDLYSAVDDFEKKLTGTIENIIAQLVFSSYFQGLFDQLQQKMEDSFGEGGDGDIVDDIVWFSKVYKDQIAAYGESMEEVRKEMERQGFDIFRPDEVSRSAASKAISGVSQDSFDDFSGRLTFLVMKVSDLGTINASILDTNQEQLAVMHAMLGHMEEIAENSRFLQHLREIDENIERLAREGTYIKR